MAEYIEREAVIDKLDMPTQATGGYGAGITIATDRAIAIVRCFPAADVVEVCRCKDCENWREHIPEWTGKDYGYCRVCMMDTKKEHFCSYGERKEG